MYQNGLAVECNPVEAAKWYRAAAVQGLDVAEFNMAVCYLNGTGVEQNDELAVALLHHSAEQGYPLAFSEMGTLFRFGRGVKHHQPPSSRHCCANGGRDLLGNLADYRIKSAAGTRQFAPRCRWRGFETRVGCGSELIVGLRGCCGGKPRHQR
jgi:TPR repeat protein